MVPLTLSAPIADNSWVYPIKTMRPTLLFLAIATLVLPNSSYSQSSTELERFGVRANLAPSWTTVESHTPTLPNFGVYMAKSDDGGYFWLMVNEYRPDRAVERVPHPDSLSEGVSIRSIPQAERPEGYVQGHILERGGIANYFFVLTDEERLFRFRVGFDF